MKCFTLISIVTVYYSLACVLIKLSKVIISSLYVRIKSTGSSLEIIYCLYYVNCS